MFKKLFKKENKEQKEKINETVNKINNLLETCKQSKHFCIFASYVSKQEENERIISHNMITFSFDYGDLPMTIKSYEGLANNEIQKSRLHQVQEKIPGAVSAPIKNEESKPLETFKVEEDIKAEEPISEIQK